MIEAGLTRGREEDRQNSVVYLVTESPEKASILQGLGLPVVPISGSVPAWERQWQEIGIGRILGNNGHLGALIQSTALMKVEAVRPQILPGEPILATDAAKVVGELLMQKPESPEIAVEMILAQSGKKTTQIGALALWDGATYKFGVTRTVMTVKELARHEVKEYVVGHPDFSLRSAGGLSITGPDPLHFYEAGPYPALIETYDMGGNREKVWDGQIDGGDLGSLQQAIIGCHPYLLRAMGLIK